MIQEGVSNQCKTASGGPRLNVDDVVNRAIMTQGQRCEAIGGVRRAIEERVREVEALRECERELLAELPAAPAPQACLDKARVSFFGLNLSPERVLRSSESRDHEIEALHRRVKALEGSVAPLGWPADEKEAVR